MTKDEALEVITKDLPEAWADLVKAIVLLGKHRVNDNNPLSCSHDLLMVMSDDLQYTPEEIEQLKNWNFDVHDEGGFYSFKYGSA